MRGLNLFVVWVLSGTPVQVLFQFHALFLYLSVEELNGNNKIQNMAFTEKNIKYADLIVPIKKCPLGESVSDCPFTNYWKIEDVEKQILLVDELPEEKLDELRAFHRKCLNIKIERAQEESARIYENF